VFAKGPFARHIERLHSVSDCEMHGASQPKLLFSELEPIYVLLSIDGGAGFPVQAPRRAPANERAPLERHVAWSPAQWLRLGDHPITGTEQLACPVAETPIGGRRPRFADEPRKVRRILSGAGGGGGLPSWFHLCEW
jgi:hypothetical protein